jgi:hypothetical protein
MGEVSMLRITIDSYHIKEIAKKKSDLYKKLAQHYNDKECSVFGSPWPLEFASDEEIDKKYFGDWSAFVNSPEDVHPEIIGLVKWLPILPLKMLGDTGVMKESIVEAVKLNQVRMPDNMMLQVREVKAAEDMCTDDLQKNYLDEGWKILAVLPQNGQRRPDYVLCKF